MDFKQAAKLGSYLAKDYAENLFRLLMNYHDISASEAASRLNMHIKTVQDSLEGMTELGIISKKEVIEKKRPYNRYTLVKDKISLNIDLNDLLTDDDTENDQDKRIREKQNSGVRFTTSRDGQQISSVSIWLGDGRDRKERKINFSNAQGKFMFHLPFPTANYKSIGEIMKQSDIDSEHHSEINDIVEEMIRLNVIEESKY